MTHLDMSAEAIARRIAQASALSDLDARRRLDTKIDLSADAVSRRLNDVFELNDLCQRLRAVPLPGSDKGF
jgi:hypothetical protein